MVAVKVESGRASTMWMMNINEALKLGDEGRDQIRWAAGKLCSEGGCDLTSLGVRAEHCKSDATLVLVEGTGQIGDQEAIRVGTVEFFGVGMTRTLLLKIEVDEGTATVSSLGWGICASDTEPDSKTLH